MSIELVERLSNAVLVTFLGAGNVKDVKTVNPLMFMSLIVVVALNI
jgi:hypothetical protein